MAAWFLRFPGSNCPSPLSSRQSLLSTVPILSNSDSTLSNFSSVWGLVREGSSGKLVLRIPRCWCFNPCSSSGYYCGSPVLRYVRCYPIASFVFLSKILLLQLLEPLVLCSHLLIFWGCEDTCYLVLLSMSLCYFLMWKWKNYAVATIFPESSMYLILIQEVWCGSLVWPLLMLLNPFFWHFSWECPTSHFIV